MSDPLIADQDAHLTAAMNKAFEPGVHDLYAAQPDALFARIELLPVRYKKESEEAGHDVFKDEQFIRIYMPGGDEVCRPVVPEDRMKFPNAFRAWELGQHDSVQGLPLDKWQEITPAPAKTLAAQNVMTVEQLAALSDAHCETLGTFSYDLRDKAQAFLSRSKVAAEAGRLNDLEAQNARLQAQLDALKAQMPQEEPEVPKGPMSLEEAQAELDDLQKKPGRRSKETLQRIDDLKEILGV